MPVSMCWRLAPPLCFRLLERQLSSLIFPLPTPLQVNGLESERSPMSCPGESMNLTETVDLTASGVQVISAAGEHIIAVANPALAMSPTFNEVLKRNAASPEV